MLLLLDINKNQDKIQNKKRTFHPIRKTKTKCKNLAMRIKIIENSSFIFEKKIWFKTVRLIEIAIFMWGYEKKSSMNKLEFRLFSAFNIHWVHRWMNVYTCARFVLNINIRGKNWNPLDTMHFSFDKLSFQPIHYSRRPTPNFPIHHFPTPFQTKNIKSA